MNGNVDIDHSHAEHEDGEGECGCDACEDGQGDGDHEEEGHNKPVYWIEDGHDVLWLVLIKILVGACRCVMETLYCLTLRGTDSEPVSCGNKQKIVCCRR